MWEDQPRRISCNIQLHLVYLYQTHKLKAPTWVENNKYALYVIKIISIANEVSSNTALRIYQYFHLNLITLSYIKFKSKVQMCVLWCLNQNDNFTNIKQWLNVSVLVVYVYTG